MRPRARMRVILARRAALRLGQLVVLAALGAATAFAASSGAASSSTIVNATVPSATNIDASACATGTPATEIGIVLPGSAAGTAVDCGITFGSSNDTARLAISQQDGWGYAMFKPTSGSTDTAYGSSGLRMGSVEAYGFAQDQERRVLAFGDAASSCSDGDARIVRYTSTGAVDTTFGASGTVSDAQSPSWNDKFAAGDVAANGDIFVAGWMATGNCDTGRRATLQHRDTTGALVTTWGTGGRYTFGFESFVGGVVALDDGSALVAGTDGSSSADRCFLAKFTPAGALDTGFGASGIRRVTSFADGCIFNGVVRQPDGSFVLSGIAGAGGPMLGLLARITSTGALDATFGTGGIATTTINSDDTGFVGLALQPDGRIVTTGIAEDSGGHDSMLVARFLATGAPDTAFGTSGSTLIRPPGDANVGALGEEASTKNVLVDIDGTIVFATSGGTPYHRIFAARVSADGVQDKSFGTNGIAQLDLTPNASWPAAVFPNRDGGVLVAGNSTGQGQLGIRALIGTRVRDYATGSFDFTNGASMFGACLRQVSGGAATDGTTWTPNAACPLSSGAYWNAVPTAAGTVALTSSSGTTAASASLRFAFRAGTTQSPGRYLAPVVFTVSAP